MIKFVGGDFFDYHADIRINTVNCVGVMGAGVALQFKDKYPKMYDEYVKACNSESIKIGHPQVWQDNSAFSNDRTIIINFPTKNHWKNPSKYEYIEEGLEWLKGFLKDKPGLTITVPALGCGHGGLDWAIVKGMISTYLQDIPMTILVFEPESSNKNLEINANIDKELKEKGIIKLTNDTISTDKLKRKIPNLIYLEGNEEILFYKKIVSIIVDSKAIDKEKNAVLECVDELPQNLVYMMGFGSSFESDILKKLLLRKLQVIIVLPYGILEIKKRKDLIPLWDKNLITLISLSKPKQTWKSYESINALKFRFSASDAILIANFDFESLMSYENELRESKKSIFFINYWKENISFFKNISAKQIGRDKDTLKPNLKPILESF
jgi:O-acetyl-ADP-ribose deacetylase (regulator of RNase III)